MLEGKSKAKETPEERQRRIINNKLQTALFKQKEALKKEIQKKRALMEKALTTEIQVRTSINCCKYCLAHVMNTATPHQISGLSNELLPSSSEIVHMGLNENGQSCHHCLLSAT